jgi:hypothetical protein
LVSILRYFEKYQYTAKEYAKVMATLKELNTSIREQNIATLELVPWETIFKNGFSPKKLNSNFEKALYGLYTMLPVRRASDYRKMDIVHQGETLDPEKNYLVVDSKGVCVSMQYGDYKTVRLYGVQTVKISQRLNEAISPYVHSQAFGKPLFPSATGGYLSESAFSQMVSDLFSRVNGQKITINTLRQSVITYYNSLTDTTVADRKKFAESMAHSVETQALYVKVKQPEASGSGRRKYTSKKNNPTVWLPWLFSVE